MWVTFIKWREQNEVDTVCETYKFDEIGEVQKYYPHNYHGVDREGRPIYIERNGMVEIEGLFKVTTEDRMIRHYIESYETLINLRFPVCSVLSGKRIDHGINILDMKGGSMKMFNSKVRALV